MDHSLDFTDGSVLDEVRHPPSGLPSTLMKRLNIILELGIQVTVLSVIL